MTQWTLILLTTFLLLGQNSSGQTNQLTLPKQFNSLIFDKTNVAQGRNIIGKPSSERESWSNANLGFMCVRAYLTNLTFDNIGCELTFYSFKKDKNDKKVLSVMAFNSNSTIKINDSLQLNYSDTSAVKKTFGTVGGSLAIDKEKNEINWNYKLILNSQNVSARFIFNSTGVLQKLEIMMGE